MGSSDFEPGLSRYFWDLDPAVNSDSSDWDRDGTDEANDDRTFEGETVFAPGRTAESSGALVVLTVWDKTHEDADDPGWEADQAAAAIFVLPMEELPPPIAGPDPFQYRIGFLNTSDVGVSGVAVQMASTEGELEVLGATLETEDTRTLDCYGASGSIGIT